MIRFISISLIGLALLLIAVSIIGQHNGTTPFKTDLGGDYPVFYAAGQAGERLYDLELQDRLYHQIVPGSNQFICFPYAPFLMVIFRPLALLPYTWSYVAWLAIGAILAVIAVRLLTRSVAAGFTATLAALSFPPLLLEGWIGGQTTALVLFCVSLAIHLNSRGRAAKAGMVLAVLAFKPTLLILLVPMLLVTRSFRVLLGMVVGGMALVVLSLWAVGCQGFVDYLRFLIDYGRITTAHPEMLKATKYVDLRSIVPALHGNVLAESVLIAIGVVVGLLLLRTWRNANWKLCWATALIFTPVLSPHCAIYDTALLIPAAFLLKPSRLMVAVYVTAAVSQPIMVYAGFQPLSIVILLCGLYYLVRSKCQSTFPSPIKTC